MEKIYVEDVTLNEGEDLESRECICTLSNGTEIHIVACYESWQQYGGTQNELWLTVDIAEAINDWLHGFGPMPDECELLMLVDHEDDDY